MFTICFFIFASAVATEPLEKSCYSADKADVARVTAECKELDKDPVTTCEVQRMGALKYFVRVRRLEGA